jgi:hypothetical protein
MRAKRHDENRLFVRDGWRHYRRSYSLSEVRWGLVVLATLLLIAAWVAYRGAHPDPSLFAAPAPEGKSKRGEKDRGLLPEDLASAGWSEGRVSQFDADNLYEKINGRADYYKSFGFRRLTFVTLRREGGGGTTIDLELYDLDQTQNALGAYAGERGPDVESALSASGLSHIARNALMMTQGRYYLRAIGADEAPDTIEQLKRLRMLFAAKLPAAPLPWGYALLVGQLGIAPQKVSYVKENAFSLGFARDVYIARQDDETTAWFVVATADPSAARQLAARFRDAFGSQGEAADPLSGVAVFSDPFLGTLSAVTTPSAGSSASTAAATAI